MCLEQREIEFVDDVILGLKRVNIAETGHAKVKILSLLSEH